MRGIIVNSTGTATKIKEELHESKRREALQKKIAAKIKKDGLLAALEQFGRKSNSANTTNVDDRINHKKGAKTSHISSVDDDKGKGISSTDGNKFSDSTNENSLLSQRNDIVSDGMLNLSPSEQEVGSPGRHVRISLSPHAHGWDLMVDGPKHSDDLHMHAGNKLMDDYDQLLDDSMISPLRDNDETLIEDDAYQQSLYNDGDGVYYDSTYSPGDDESYDDSQGDGEESPLGFSYTSLPHLDLDHPNVGGHAESNTQSLITSTAADRLYISDDED